MCGESGLWATPKQAADHIQLQVPLPFTPRYNIAPSQEILAVGQAREGKRKAAKLRWGLVLQGQGRKGRLQGDQARAVSIVTTKANEAVAELHDRMPVIIGEADFDLWLDRSVEDPERLQSLLAPIGGHELEIYPVGLEVNSPKNDSAELIKKAG